MDFIQKIQCLTTTDFPVSEYSKDEEKLYLAAKAFLLSDEAKAEEIIKDLYKTTTNNEIKNITISILSSLLVWQGRFNELSNFGIPRNQEEGMAISLYNSNNLIEKLTDKIDCLNLIPSDVGWAIIKVKINNKEVELMVDTGAMITTINETTAKECGIIPKESLSGANAVGGQISVKNSEIEKITIGESLFLNKSCLVIPDNMIDFGEHKINGTVGWELICKLKWVIDYRNKVAYISAPRKENVVHNMLCDYFPMTRVKINNKYFILGLDTGANKTRFGSIMKDYFKDFKQATVKTEGAGSFIEENTYIIPEVDIFLENALIKLEDLNLTLEDYCNKSQFYITPGILGNDIINGKALTIDFYNRHLSIQ